MPTSLGGLEMSALAGVDFEVQSRTPPEFPFADATIRHATNADLPRVAEEKTLGAGFDEPGPRAAATAK